MFKIITTLFISTVLLSCSDSSNSETLGEEGFSSVEANLKSEFGDKAYYTEVSITPVESIGNVINATVTKDPESLKMGQWTWTLDNWEQTTEVSIEIPEGTKASDFMFQLGSEVSLKKLGELVEKSKAELLKEKKLDNAKLHMAFIKYPDNGDVSKAEYVVMLQPETGGTTFTYSYELNGNLIEMDY